MKPTLLYQIASVLLIFLATGHTIAILKLKPPSPENETVWNSMNSVHFQLGRGEYSYGGFYRGLGLFVTIYLLFAAYLAWYLSGMARQKSSGHRLSELGILCPSVYQHRFERDLFFSATHRPFDPGGDMCGLGCVGDPRSQALALSPLSEWIRARYRE